MTNALSSMGYPHWLIVAGAVLLVLGFIGLAFRQRKDAEAKLKEMANGNEQGRSDLAELDSASAAIEVQGARYPEAMQRLIDK